MKKRKFMPLLMFIIVYLVVFIGNVDVDSIKNRFIESHTENSMSNLGYNDGTNTIEIPLVEVEPCDLSGDRQPAVKVDIGYDSSYANREYWAYTNDLSQVFYVHADELVLQNDELENNGSERYCSDEAKVDGVEASDLDEGHVIADSLGGVSNAYNITPQDSELNRHGTQAKFEEEIREALATGKQVTDFNASIDYNDNSMIPSEYHVTYKINGITKEYNFNNG